LVKFKITICKNIIYNLIFKRKEKTVYLKKNRQTKAKNKNLLIL